MMPTIGRFVHYTLNEGDVSLINAAFRMIPFLEAGKNGAWPWLHQAA